MQSPIFHKRWLLWTGVSMLGGCLLYDEVLAGAYEALFVIGLVLVYSGYLWRWTPQAYFLVIVGLVMGMAMKWSEPTPDHDDENAYHLDGHVRVESKSQKGDRHQMVVSFARQDRPERALLHLSSSCVHDTGDWLSIDHWVRRPSGPRRPGGFDYADYLLREGISWIAYVDCDDLLLVRYNAHQANALERLRSGVVRLIDRAPDPHTSALLKGILLGDKSSMSRVDRERYARSGIAYVFAVSGMHVGILYGLMSLMFGRWRGGGRWRTAVSMMCTLSVIWLFVALAGCTPSAVRAALMLSLYELGRSTYRQIDRWQILGAGLTLAIMMNPNVITDIGFQLSYAALSSIFLLYNTIASLVTSRYWMLEKSWSLIALSLSAQLGILPLLLYHFGGFSPWFWFTGFFAAIVVLVNFYLGLVYVFAVVLPVDVSLVADMIGWLFYWLDSIIDRVAAWPLGYVEIDLTMIDVVQYYILLSACWCMICMPWDRFQLVKKISTLAMVASLVWSPLFDHLLDAAPYVYEADGRVCLSYDGTHERLLGAPGNNFSLKLGETVVTHVLQDRDVPYLTEGSVLLTSGLTWQDKRAWRDRQHLKVDDITYKYITLK